MNELEEIIRAEIKKEGGIPFARLMELALYCPQFGYYDRIENRIGHNEDYYTSVSAGSLFGELLAFQFASWMEQMGDGEFQLLEAGAHDGRLALDILAWFASRRPELSRRLHYWILEPLQARQASQRRRLESFKGQARWFDQWHALPQTGVCGVIFSNELLDAMPVHRVGWNAQAGEWFEWGVEITGTKLGWTRLAIDSSLTDFPLLAQLPAELLAVLPDGFTTELCPAAVDWWRSAAESLKRGKLLTCDYGLDAGQFFLPERSEGTLRAYHRHHVSSDLLARVGEQDLTAHVDFTALQSAGELAGLRTEAMVSQSEFLIRIFAAVLKDAPDFLSAARAREFQTLTHPEHLGRAFKVLVQSRRA